MTRIFGRGKSKSSKRCSRKKNRKWGKR
jgi:hypothetical protein